MLCILHSFRVDTSRRDERDRRGRTTKRSTAKCKVMLMPRINTIINVYTLQGKEGMCVQRGDKLTQTREENRERSEHAVSERRVVNKAEKVLVFVCFPSGRVTDVRLGKQMISGIDLRLWLRDLT